MHKKNLIITILLIALFATFSCKDDVLPKPSSYLRLDYTEAKYVTFENQCSFSFEINSEALIKGQKDCGFTVSYPKMKATIYPHL